MLIENISVIKMNVSLFLNVNNRQGEKWRSVGGFLDKQILPMIIFEHSFRDAELRQFDISYFVG